MDQKLPSLCSDFEQGSIVEVRDAKRPRIHLLPINIFNDFKIIVALKEKFCHPDIALVCLRAIAGQEVGLNHVLDNIHTPDSEEGRVLLFLEFHAKVYCRLHCPDLQGIATDNAGHLICKVT